MTYDGITPVGVPGEWLLFMDAAVFARGGGPHRPGVRRSTLFAPGIVVATLPDAEVVEGLGITPGRDGAARRRASPTGQ